MTNPIEYPKVETLFNRDEKFKVLTDRANFRDPAFDIPATWLVTEKVDGTNIRVHYVPEHEETTQAGGPDWGTHDWREVTRKVPASVSFHGRTAKAQMQANLLDYLQATFPVEKFAGFPGEMTLFGEGYGAKVQKGGGNYRPDSVSFRLFDVAAYGEAQRLWWLNWKNVVEIAEQLDIKTVPVLHYGANLDNIVLDVSRGLKSITAGEDSGTEYESEGVVCRTDPYLLMRNGQRLVWKLKTKDF